MKSTTHQVAINWLHKGHNTCKLTILEVGNQGVGLQVVVLLGCSPYPPPPIVVVKLCGLFVVLLQKSSSVSRVISPLYLACGWHMWAHATLLSKARGKWVFFKAFFLKKSKEKVLQLQ
jgi:hypothetical protein